MLQCRISHTDTAGRPAPGKHVSACRSVGPMPRPRSGETKPTVRSTAEIGPQISFGPFRLLPERRLLPEGDSSVRLGGRALDLLLALVERPGALLSKKELIAKVWPGVFVDEGNLKVQVAALRRALGDGHDGHGYIAAVSRPRLLLCHAGDPIGRPRRRAGRIPRDPEYAERDGAGRRDAVELRRGCALSLPAAVPLRPLGRLRARLGGCPQQRPLEARAAGLGRGRQRRPTAALALKCEAIQWFPGFHSARTD